MYQACLPASHWRTRTRGSYSLASIEALSSEAQTSFFAGSDDKAPYAELRATLHNLMVLGLLLLLAVTLVN